MARSMGVDFGLKRIGLALSDESKLLARPIDPLIAERSKEKTVKRLMGLIHEHGVDELVVGMPYKLSGTEGWMADEVTEFVKELEKEFSGVVILLDERLVTAQVERVMKEGGLNRKKRSKLVDSLSAVVILQTHLSRINPME